MSANVRQSSDKPKRRKKAKAEPPLAAPGAPWLESSVPSPYAAMIGTPPEPSAGTQGVVSSPIATPSASATSPSAATLSDADKTMFAPVGVTRQWVIETERGDTVPLPGGDIVVGRQPKAIGDSLAVALPDATRTLSKTHARLTLDATSDTWSVTDLASTNGVAILTPEGELVAPPNVATVIDEYVAFGILRCRVIRI